MLRKKPTFVYRYFKEQHALEVLSTGLWKIGRLTELNDPFDCQPVLINCPKKIDNPEGFTSDYFNQFNDTIGVLCYSAKINDPVIWSHYADGHRGIALMFKYIRPENKKSLIEIKYKNNRPILDYKKLEKIKRVDGHKQLIEVIQRGFSVKAKSWEYESEYRHFIFLDGLENKIVGRNYFRPISGFEFYAVILGEKCSVSIRDIERILKKSEYWRRRAKVSMGAGYKQDILVTRAKMGWREYKMNVNLVKKNIEPAKVIGY